MLDANLSGTDSDFTQTYRPTAIAHSNDTRLPIHHCPCKGINAKGTQKIKKYVAGTTNNNTTIRNTRFISSASNSSLTPILELTSAFRSLGVSECATDSGFGFIEIA